MTERLKLSGWVCVTAAFAAMGYAVGWYAGVKSVPPASTASMPREASQEAGMAFDPAVYEIGPEGKRVYFRESPPRDGHDGVILTVPAKGESPPAKVDDPDDAHSAGVLPLPK